MSTKGKSTKAGQNRNKISNRIDEHSWNKERTQVAVTSGKNVLIFDAAHDNPRKWNKLHTLTYHTETVSSVDWHQQSNQIVTCSHDRNAFVWNYNEDNDSWHHKLVILRIDRAANQVRFSPDGKKFAVASSAKKVPVCHFEQEQSWWISTMIKRHKSTVTCLAWHPNSQLIATGACDFRCRVFSCYLEQVDGEQDNGPFEEGYGFGEMIADFDCKGWIEAVAWSPDGQKLAYAGHDSSITFIEFSGDGAESQNMKLKCLPFRDLMFVTDERLIAVGYDFNPNIFDKQGDTWVVEGIIDNGKMLESGKKKKGKNAFGFWHQKAEQGTEGKANDIITTKHDNTITCIRAFGTADGETKFSTSGVDGRIHFWDVPHEGGEEGK